MDAAGADIGKELLESGAIHVSAGVAAVIVAGGRQGPAFGTLAGDEGLGSFALRAYRVANGELPTESEEELSRDQLDSWRMPPLESLKPGKLTGANRLWMGVLRGYLVLAVGMVIFKVVQMAM